MNHAHHGETVLLLHGLFAGAWMMQPLTRHLARAGFDCVNHGYPTARDSITELARPLAALLRKLDTRPDVRMLHAVTHSMGGIMLRQAVAYYRPTKLRRVVMLAPPNSGSHVARLVRPLVGRLIRPIAEMADADDSLVRALPAVPGAQVGVIAASWDMLVPRACTHLPGQADHITLRASHVSLPLQRHAARQTLAFLTDGAFSRATVE